MILQMAFGGPRLAVSNDGPPKLIGTAVPYGVASACSSDGNRYRFSGPPEGDLSGTVVVREHDDLTPIGQVANAESDASGLSVQVALLDTTAGRDAHTEALAGVRNGFSVSCDPENPTMAEDGVFDIDKWRMVHLGHVRHPAFENLTPAIAASKLTEPEEPAMTEPTPAPEIPAPAPVPVAVRTALRLPTPAEYGFAVLAAMRAETAGPALARLAEYRQALLAAGETLVADVPGVIPTPIVGPVIDARPYDRPIFSALGPMAGPSAGASWEVPLVSDPLSDAAAVAELTSADDTLGISPVSVTWQAIKRSTKVSRETQVFSDPSIMGIVTEQLARAYARGSEANAANELVTAIGGNTAIVLALDGSDAVGQIVTGSTVIYGQTGSPADTLFVNPTDYGKMAAWTATDGRPLFPSMGSLVNVGGETGGATQFVGNIAGVRVICSWALAAGQNYLIASDFIRSYEGNRATVSVDMVTFGVDVGIFGTVATKVLVPKARTPVSISATVMAATEGKHK